jgi:hypothetical protein
MDAAPYACNSPKTAFFDWEARAKQDACRAEGC